jgi:hypothetical protein
MAEADRGIRERRGERDPFRAVRERGWSSLLGVRVCGPEEQEADEKNQQVRR